MTNELFVQYSKSIYNIDLSEKQLNQFAIYASFLMEMNEHMNLISKSTIDNIYCKHFLDSISICRFLDPKKSIVDIGFGAGFPSVPAIIINPTIKWTLVDNDRTKCIFVKRLLNMLKIENVKIICGNINEVKLKSDILVSRAFASLDKLLPLGKKILNQEGCLLYLTVKDNCQNLPSDLYEVKSFSYQLPDVENLYFVHCIKINKRK